MGTRSAVENLVPSVQFVDNPNEDFIRLNGAFSDLAKFQRVFYSIKDTLEQGIQNQVLSCGLAVLHFDCRRWKRILQNL